MRPVAVLMGGTSPEHSVSLRSGRAVTAGLAREGRYLPRSVVIDRAGAWHLEGEEGRDPEAALGELARRGTICCFIALHGPGGEDGTIQGFLETCRMPYTGSGVVASALAMSKSATRALLRSRGLPTAPGFASLPEDPESLARQVDGEVGFPLFLKEDFSGSSLGVWRLENREELLGLLRRERPAGTLVVERALAGGEASVGTLGGGRVPVRSLPPVEIVTRHPFFDYAAKYDPEVTQEFSPPRAIPAPLQERLGDLARRVHRLLGCAGAARTDFILTPEGPVILECNTVPGLTPESLLPKAARAAGIPFPRLVTLMVEMALAEGAHRDGRPSRGAGEEA